MLIQKNNLVIGTDILQYQGSFLDLYLVFGECGHILQFRNLDDGEIDIVPESGEVNLQALPYPVPVGLADCQKSYLHISAKLIKVIVPWLEFCKKEVVFI